MKATPIILDSVRLALEGEEQQEIADAAGRREIADALAKRRQPARAVARPHVIEPGIKI